MSVDPKPKALLIGARHFDQLSISKAGSKLFEDGRLAADEEMPLLAYPFEQSCTGSA
jgi:hypothetical protein